MEKFKMNVFMKILFVFLFIFQCSDKPKKNPSDYIVPLYSLNYLYEHRTIDYKSCIQSASEYTTATCDNAEIIAQNDCKSGNIRKGNTKFFKYLSAANESLSFLVGGFSSNAKTNCLKVYKENISTTSTLLDSDLEGNQNTTSCKETMTVSATSNSYRCIAIQTACDSLYSIRTSNTIDGLTVSATGTANTNVPSGWAASNTNYTSITGTKTLGNGTTVIPIGFNFTYYGQSYSNIYVSGAFGNLSFGSTAKEASYDRQNLFGTSTYFYLQTPGPVLKSVIAPWWTAGMNSDCDTSTQYITTGVSPNRIFTVEWKNFYNSYTNGKGFTVNFQVKLYETSNKIELIYGPTSGTTSSYDLWATIGISNSVGGTGNYVNGKSGSSSDTTQYPSSAFPASGTVYRFTP